MIRRNFLKSAFGVATGLAVLPSVTKTKELWKMYNYKYKGCLYPKGLDPWDIDVEYIMT